MNSLKHPSHSKTTRTIPKHSPEPVSSSTMAEEKTGLSNVVRFHDVIPIPQQTNEREKYLTAKYPPEQMQLIRKRLKVEFWLDDQLRSLYKIKDDDATADHDHCPGDLIDSLLDMDNESERQTFLLTKLSNVKQPRSIIIEFIDQLLNRVKML